MRITEIAAYTLEFRSTPEEHVPMLVLLDAEAAPIATVAFADGVEPLPGPREASTGIVALTFPPATLGDVMHTLREEKPVFFRWDEQAGTAAIATDEEGVGEAEARTLLDTLFG